MNSHIYNIERDPDGTLVIARERVFPPGGGVSVGPRVDFVPLNVQTATGIYPNIQRIEAVCIATGVSGGFFNIRGASGAFSDLLVSLAQFGPVNPGTVRVWEFPTPIQTDDASNRQIHVQQTASGMGGWFFTSNGYYTKVIQLPATQTF